MSVETFYWNGTTGVRRTQTLPYSSCCEGSHLIYYDDLSLVLILITIILSIFYYLFWCSLSCRIVIMLRPVSSRYILKLPCRKFSVSCLITSHHHERKTRKKTNWGKWGNIYRSSVGSFRLLAYSLSRWYFCIVHFKILPILTLAVIKKLDLWMLPVLVVTVNFSQWWIHDDK